MSAEQRAEGESASWLRAYIARASIIAFTCQLGGTAVGIVPIISRVMNGAIIPFVQQWIWQDRTGVMLGEIGPGLVGGLIWMALVRRRKHDRTLHQIARHLARFTLAGTMLDFALWKLFPNWGGLGAALLPPMPGDMTVPFGSYTPESFFWQWPGVAPGYVLFTAMAELAGGVLVLINRTVLLGALLDLASLVNIAIMIEGFLGLGDSFFWTPGRRFFPLAFILYDQWPRIRGLLFRDDTAVAPATADVWRHSRTRYIVLAAQFIVIARIFQVEDWLGYWTRSHQMRGRRAIEASYEVERLTVNGEEPTEAERWVSLGIADCTAYLRTLTTDTLFVLAIDSDAQPQEPCGSAVATSRRFGIVKDTLYFSRGASDMYKITGRVGGKAVASVVRRRSDEEWALFDPAWFWVRGRGR